VVTALDVCMYVVRDRWVFETGNFGAQEVFETDRFLETS